MPGPFRSSITPYAREISIAARDPRTRWLVAVMGSQLGKTEACFNIIGHKLDNDPEPILYIGPTEKNIIRKIEPRIDQMIRSAATLKAKYVGGKQSTKTSKLISGVTLSLGWAGSATELASQPAAMVLIDELDRMRDIPGEGSVVSLSEARMETYTDSLGVIDSTPTIGTVETYVDEQGIERWKRADPDDVESKTWLQWQEGSREEWAVPCPHCNQYFVPRFKLLIWSKGDLDTIEKSAGMTCQRCGELISDKHRVAMNAAGTFLGPGQWVDEDGCKQGELISTDRRTFWVSGLMSPFKSWGHRAKQWMTASRSKDQGVIQAVKNTRFGELYALKGDAPEWEIVRSCAGDYETGVAPTGVQRIFCSVDVQGDRLIYVIRGWGYSWESWGIEADVIYAGNTTKDPDDSCWAELEKLLDRTFDGLPIRWMAIDGGFNKDAVAAFVLKHPFRSLLTIGRDNRQQNFSAKAEEVDDRGRKIKTGLIIWSVDHGHYKGWVYERIKRPNDKAGAWHIARDMGAAGRDKPGESYCKQVVAETAINLPSGRTIWRKAYTENHYLDCEYLNAFLAEAKGVRNLKPIEETSTDATDSIEDLARALNE